MRVAILGVYPEGGESSDSQEVQGKWSPWRLPNQSPHKLWCEAAAELRRLIRRHGHLNLYVYFGHDLPIEQVFQVDELVVEQALVPAAGPTFDIYREVKSRVWIRYAGVRKIRPLRRDDFREVPLVQGKFSTSSRPMGELSWTQMHHTGLTFVEDPSAR